MVTRYIQKGKRTKYSPYKEKRLWFYYLAILVERSTGLLKNELNVSQSEQRGTAAKQKTAVFVAINSTSDVCILKILKYTSRGISIRLASPVSPTMINEGKYLAMAFPRKYSWGKKGVPARSSPKLNFPGLDSGSPPIPESATSCMYVCMNGHTYGKSMDQPGKVASPACCQLNKQNEYFPVRVRA